LQHPGIVTVRDSGVWKERPWYVMDYVGTTNLADVLEVRGAGTPDDLHSLIQAVSENTLPALPQAERHGLPISVAVRLISTVAKNVAAAHARGCFTAI